MFFFFFCENANLIFHYIGFALLSKLFGAQIMVYSEVRALCRQVRFFHARLRKQFFHGAVFVHNDIVMLKLERDRRKTVDIKLKIHG